MSYILEALKKSEAQRRPDRPAEAVFAPAPPTSGRRPPPWGLVATALAALALAVALYGLGRGSVGPVPNGADDATARLSAPRVSASTAPPSALGQAAPQASQVSPSEWPFQGRINESAARAPRDEETRQAEAGGRPAPAPPAAAPEPAPTRTAEAVATAPEPPSAPPVTAVAAPAPKSIAPAPLLQALPAEVRARLPNLTLNIHVYSDDRSARFVFINNRRYREGETIAEGGRVEAITPAGAILSAGGERFRLAL